MFCKANSCKQTIIKIPFHEVSDIIDLKGHLEFHRRVHLHITEMSWYFKLKYNTFERVYIYNIQRGLTLFDVNFDGNRHVFECTYMNTLW